MNLNSNEVYVVKCFKKLTSKLNKPSAILKWRLLNRRFKPMISKKSLNPCKHAGHWLIVPSFPFCNGALIYAKLFGKFFDGHEFFQSGRPELVAEGVERFGVGRIRI